MCAFPHPPTLFCGPRYTVWFPGLLSYKRLYFQFSDCCWRASCNRNKNHKGWSSHSVGLERGDCGTLTGARWVPPGIHRQEQYYAQAGMGTKGALWLSPSAYLLFLNDVFCALFHSSDIIFHPSQNILKIPFHLLSFHFSDSLLIKISHLTVKFERKFQRSSYFQFQFVWLHIAVFFVYLLISPCNSCC